MRNGEIETETMDKAFSTYDEARNYAATNTLFTYPNPDGVSLPDNVQIINPCLTLENFQRNNCEIMPHIGNVKNRKEVTITPAIEEEQDLQFFNQNDEQWD